MSESPKRFRFTITRILVGVALFAIALAWAQDNLLVGSVLGTAWFLLALVTRKSDIPIIVRSYVGSGIGAFIGFLLGPAVGRDFYQRDLQAVLIGAVFGWAVAAVLNLPRDDDPDQDEADDEGSLDSASDDREAVDKAGY